MVDSVAKKKGFTLSVEEILERLERIEGKVDHIIEQRAMKEFYSTAEVAVILDKAEWTVREWCRLGRINAMKRLTGRGNAKEWCVPNTELVRYQAEGLLPAPAPSLGFKSVG